MSLFPGAINVFRVLRRTLRAKAVFPSPHHGANDVGADREIAGPFPAPCGHDVCSVRNQCTVGGVGVDGSVYDWPRRIGEAPAAEVVPRK